MGKLLALSTLLFVHISGDGNTPAWKARALEGTIAQYLTRFEKLQLAEDIQISDFNCEEQDINCLLNNAKDKKIGVMILGQLKNNHLFLDAYDTGEKRKINSTDIPLSQDLNQFKHSIFKLIKPFIDLGGIVDQLQERQGATSPVWQIISLILGVCVATALIFAPSFLRKPLQRPLKKIKTWPLKPVLGGLGIILILALIVQSILYHPIYEARMEKMKSRAEELKNGK